MALDAFLKIEEPAIDGESTVKGQEKQFQLSSFSFSASNSGSRHSATGGGTGKGDPSDLMCTMDVDKSSPKLYQACLSGVHIKKATLFVRKAAGTEAPVTYMTVVMNDGLISSFSQSAATGNETSQVSFSVNFASVLYTYTPQEAEGTPGGDVVAGWDIAKGEKMG
jgi:type VI secretion system secreted protein Hcp